MKWLWFAGPLVLLLTYWGISLWPPREERRLRRELRRWIDEVLGPLHLGEKVRSRRVLALPPGFDALLEEAGGGTRVTDVVLVPKRAYFAARFADATTSSNQFTVLCRLAKAAPKMVCRPLPIVEGKPVVNSGVHFDDEDFMDCFIVESQEIAAAKKWFRPELREALMDLPDVWLRVEGRMMALTLYGSADADRLDELVGVADAIFAERGAGGGQSLFGDGPAPEPLAAKNKKEPAPQPAPGLLRIAASAIDFAIYGVGLVFLAAIVGKFASWHPAVFFASPDIVVTEQWQGGWTTKGVGMFILAETILLGTFVYQTYLGITAGQSIGKRLVGTRVVRGDGTRPDFWRAIVLRRWIFGAIPIAVAAAMARPFQATTFFAQIPTLPTAGAAGLVLVLLAASIAGGWAVSDRLSGTREIRVEPWRLPAIQLGAEGAEGVDPLMFRRQLGIAAVVVGFILINVFAQFAGVGFWIY